MSINMSFSKSSFSLITIGFKILAFSRFLSVSFSISLIFLSCSLFFVILTNPKASFFLNIGFFPKIKIGFTNSMISILCVCFA